MIDTLVINYHSSAKKSYFLCLFFLTVSYENDFILIDWQSDVDICNSLIY